MYSIPVLWLEFSLFFNTVAKIQKAMWKKQRQKKRTTCKHKIITYKVWEESTVGHDELYGTECE